MRAHAGNGQTLCAEESDHRLWARQNQGASPLALDKERGRPGVGREFHAEWTTADPRVR
jgi:hypothetical protein